MMVHITHIDGAITIGDLDMWDHVADKDCALDLLISRNMVGKPGQYKPIIDCTDDPDIGAHICTEEDYEWLIDYLAYHSQSLIMAAKCRDLGLIDDLMTRMSDLAAKNHMRDEDMPKIACRVAYDLIHNHNKGADDASARAA